MKLKDLQMRSHGKDHNQHRITYVNEKGTQCRETLYSGANFAQHVIDCLEATPELRKERDSANSQLGAVVALLKNNNLFHTDLLTSMYRILVPQLSEIRYVLHGDIQPCSVLYSDDTTTLLRLDEGDIMCETDTIEWSDSVTYRCQELLKSATSVHIAVPLKTSKLFAQLVRDERILLNDNGDDETVEKPTAVVPAPPPFGHEKPDHNNPYVHTTEHLASQPKQER